MDKKIPARETRAIVFDRAQVKQDSRSVELAFSSEEPVARWWGIEVLSHAPGAMRMDRMRSGGALLLDHDMTKQIGVVEECRCDGDLMGRATVRFSRGVQGEEVYQDVMDGIRKNISVGYQVHRAEEMDPKKMPADLMEMAAREKLPVYRVVDWEPVEISVVAVPADPSVGIGRSEEGVVIPSPVIVPTHIIEVIEKENRAMPEDNKTFAEFQAELKSETKKSADAARSEEIARVSAINTIFDKFSRNIPKMLREKAIKDGTSVQEFQETALNYIGNGTPLDTPVNELDLSPRDLQRYSISRAIMSQIPGSGVDASFERACHSEIQKRLGTAARGLLVPYDVMRQPAQVRDLSLQSDAAGGYLKGTDHMGSEFIDILRANMLIRKLGCKVLTGLRESISIPKRTAGASSYWIADGSAPTEGSNTFGTLALAPKHVGANVDYTRGLLLQSNPSIDALVNGDLAQSIALAIDLAAFEGAGTAEPTGISNTASIGTFTGTSLDFAGLLNAQSDVATANALSTNCAYVTTPAVAALLKARAEISSTYSPLWVGNLLEGVCAGFRGFTTTQITAASAIFGDFSQLILAEFGTMDLVVNNLNKTGIIEVTAFQSVDVGVRYAGAFSRATSIT